MFDPFGLSAQSDAKFLCRLQYGKPWPDRLAARIFQQLLALSTVVPDRTRPSMKARRCRQGRGSTGRALRFGASLTDSGCLYVL